MIRRQFLGLALPLAAARWPWLRNRVQARSAEPELTLVLRGGKWFARGAWRSGDVGVDAGGKLHFGDRLPAPDIIDVSHRVIAPGFVDLLADYGAEPTQSFPTFEKYKVSDGVTTALHMHGGSADCADYYGALEAFPHRINYGVSTFVLAIRGRTSTLRERKRQVEKSLKEGALGVSHSLEYQPTPYSEVLEYARLAVAYDRPLFLHLRFSSSENELAGVEEAVRLARDSGARVHIDHLHSTGGTFHMEEALDRIRTANAQGLVVTTCVYPYSFWATYLRSKRFDAGWQQRYGITYGDLRVAGTGERLTAESFARYRKTATLVAVPEGTMPFERTLNLALQEEFCLIGSDGGIAREPHANSHPRGAGCFATAVRHGLDIGLPLERILDKMTSLPRRVVRPALGDRGVLEEGAVADLTVFDPIAIRGNATVENPNQFSSGIDLVVVNGKPAYRAGRLAAKNGWPIRLGSQPEAISPGRDVRR